MTLFFLAVAFGGPITPLKHLGWAAPPFLSPNTTDKVTIQTLQTSLPHQRFILRSYRDMSVSSSMLISTHSRCPAATRRLGGSLYHALENLLGQLLEVEKTLPT
jgi:hypothetical protein